MDAAPHNCHQQTDQSQRYHASKAATDVAFAYKTFFRCLGGVEELLHGVGFTLFDSDLHLVVPTFGLIQGLV